MAKTTAVCVICGHPIKEDEMLVVYWFAPKSWWVYNHLRPHNPKTDSHVGYKFGEHEMVSFCGRANYNPVTGSFNT